ncbi:cell adhesion molecule 3-like isoform X1 [Portunus trituberculatus]|uniref:cell adhesion molecule 3-like isoform X1 n=1 Tax=Portunus trituberculatus TaxID=210409 RepID=UPI001E1CFEBB|nr:cell adhesion molecule 3-like isoform X1 [Portunus trituberculatus]
MKKTQTLSPLLLFLLPLFSPCSVPQRLLLLLLLLLATSLPQGASGVQVQSVKVPQPGVAGRSARLECLWRAGNRGFYSVRWYKNDEQFYSYVPKNKPQIKVDHHLQGVSVELSKSDERVVSLRELHLDSEGVYRCEVMSESPYFESSFASTNLTVVAMPAAPILSGLRPSYRVGETLNVTCTAEDARPPARLTFTMNNEQLTAESGRVHTLPVEEGSRPGVYTTRAVLERPLGSRMVPSLNLVCRAEVHSISTQVAANVEVYGHSGSAPLSLLNTGCGPSPAFPALLLLLPPLLTCLTHLLLATR